MKGYWIIIPVEIKSREFESRLLLVLEAVRNGYKVIFGAQDQIWKYIHDLPKGIYFDKSIAKNKSSFINNLAEKGFIYTGIDEEGLSSYNNPWMYLKQRVSKETLANTARFFTWGQSEAELIKSHFNNVPKEKIVTSGNPRTDIWHSGFKYVHKDKAKRYNQSYGDYILMPTSFGIVHAAGREFVKKQAKEIGIVENQQEENRFQEKIEYLQSTLEQFVELIKETAKTFNDKHIVLRPHPSEDLNYWKDVTKNLKNVHVKYEGSITPWILGCKLLIHSTCTTGLEAALMGKPVISYIPYPENEHVKHIANLASIQCGSRQEVLDKASKVLSQQKFEQNHFKDNLKYHLSSLDQANAYERIIQTFNDLSIKPTTLKLPLHRKLALFFVYDLKRNIKCLLSKQLKYKKQKMPNIKKREVLDLKEQFEDLNAKFRTVNPQVSKIGKNLFIVYSKS
jgi:surface carbohydrate biosynthesis protein